MPFQMFPCRLTRLSDLGRWLNATQILKVAGMPKTQRTKYLEKEVITGRHEKVQGGCEFPQLPDSHRQNRSLIDGSMITDGKYQGTW